MLPGTRLWKLRIGLQRLAAHRTRRREQGTLSIADIVIEKIDDASLMLDPVGDQIDTETAEQIREAAGMDIGGIGPNRLEQHICMYLDVPEAALGKLARLEVQARDVIHRKSKAVLRQCRQAFVLEGAHVAYGAMGELKQERGRDSPIGCHEVEQPRKDTCILQCCPGQIAE